MTSTQQAAGSRQQTAGSRQQAAGRVQLPIRHPEKDRRTLMELGNET